MLHVTIHTPLFPPGKNGLVLLHL